MRRAVRRHSRSSRSGTSEYSWTLSANHLAPRPRPRRICGPATRPPLAWPSCVPLQTLPASIRTRAALQLEILALRHSPIRCSGDVRRPFCGCGCRRSLFVVLSNGVSEASNEAGEPFGDERIMCRAPDHALAEGDSADALREDGVGVSAPFPPSASPRTPPASPCVPCSASATTCSRSSASASASCAILECVALWWLPCVRDYHVRMK